MRKPPAPLPEGVESCDRCGRRGKFNSMFKDKTYPERGVLRVCGKCEGKIKYLVGYERVEGS